MDKQKVKRTFLRFTKHTLFSLIGTATDTLVLWLCSNFIFSGYAGENILSPAISFECANIVNFIVSSRLVWPERMAGKRFKEYLRRFIGYNMSYTTVFFLKMGILLAIQTITKWDVVLCNLIALMIAGIVNFVMNDKVIFKNRNTNQKPELSAQD